MWYPLIAPIVLGIIAFFLGLPFVGTICFAVPVVIWNFYPQLLTNPRENARQVEIEARARRIEVMARYNGFVSVESFVNPEEKIPLPSVLYVARPYEDVLSYFAGRDVVWVDRGRGMYYIADAITKEPTTPIYEWQPVKCELLFDDVEKKVIAINTPAGQMWITKTSKGSY